MVEESFGLVRFNHATERIDDQFGTDRLSAKDRPYVARCV